MILELETNIQLLQDNTNKPWTIHYTRATQQDAILLCQLGYCRRPRHSRNRNRCHISNQVRYELSYMVYYTSFPMLRRFCVVHRIYLQ